jgi:hypothetical protein
MKTLAFAAPDRTRHSVVSDERAEEILSSGDERWSLVEDNGPDEAPVATEPVTEPDTIWSDFAPTASEPEADGGEGQPEQEE